MKHIEKNKKTILCCLLAVISLFFMSMGIRTSLTKADVSNIDLVVTASSHISETKNTEINGETVEGYFANGWGGYANVMTLTQVNGTSIKNSGKGALRFFIYFKTQDDLNTYKTIPHFNLDLCSSESYSDDYKYSWSAKDLFSECEVGWNEIVLPIAKADEQKAGMDWTTLRFLRVNCGGSVATYTATAKYSLITTDLTEKTVVKETTPEVSDVELNFTSSDFDVKTDDTLLEETVTSYGLVGKGWGGGTRYLTADKTYDVNSIFNTGKGALSFYLYIGKDTTLTKYKSLTSNYNLDVCSSSPYSDSHKYSFILATIFKDLEMGWNQIVLPLNTANEKNSMDWTTVQIFRVENSLAGLGAWENEAKFAKFTFTTTDLTKMTVVKETTPEAPAEVNDILMIASSCDDMSKNEADSIYGKTVISYGSVGKGWGGGAKVLSLSETYNAKSIYDTSKGALSFYLYIDNQTTLDAYKNSTNYCIDVSSVENYGTGADSHKYSFNISTIFKDLNLGWNHIVLPLNTAGEKNSMDWTTVRSLRINSVNAGLGGGQNESKFALFTLTTTELTAMTVVDDSKIEFVVEEMQGPNATTIADMEIDEKTVKAYQANGWGGYVNVMKLDKIYDASYYSTNTKSALTFQIYFQDASDLNTYKAFTSFIIDVSSGEEYSDAHKLSFNIASAFSKCSIGWNQIVVPLSKVNEKNSFDYSDIRTIRVNNGGEGKGTPTTTATAQFAFIESDYTEFTVVEKTPVDPGVVDTSDILMIASSYDDYDRNEADSIYGKTVTSYGSIGKQWGGGAKVLSLSETYNGKAIFDTTKGALSFYLFIGDQTTLDSYKKAPSYNIDISTIENYGTGADQHKYSFNIASIFGDLNLGWNHIVLPLSTAGEKNSMDWSTVRSIRINSTGANLGGKQNETKFALFTLTTTDLTAMTVVDDSRIDFVVEEMQGPNATTIADMEIDEKTVKAYQANGWGGYANVMKLDKTYDASFHATNSKAVLTFYMYFKDADSLNNYKKITSFNVDICSAESYNDTNKYTFNVVGVFNKCSVGWNQIVVPFSAATEKKEIDWSTIRFIRINCDGSLPTYTATAQFAFITADYTELTVVGYEQPVEPDVPVEGKLAVALDSWADLTKIEDEKIWNMTGTSYGAGNGWGNYGAKVLKLTNLANIKSIVETNHGAISFFLYIGNEGTLNAYKEATNFNIDISSGKTFSDDTKYNFNIAGIFDDLEIGWNHVVLPFSTSTVNTLDSEKVLFIRINSNDSAIQPNQNATKFALFTFLESELTEMTVVKDKPQEPERNPVMEKVIIDCDSTNGVTFSGNRIDREDFRYSLGSVYTSGAGYALSATEIEVGKTDLTKETFVLALWVWVEDVEFFSDSKVNTQIEISSNGSVFDQKELNWENWTDKLTNNGWNWVVLKGADANVSGGEPNYDSLTRFRVYVNGITDSTFKIDRVTIGHIDNESLFSAPDWENEKASSGTFKGANGLVAENGTFIEVDFNEAEDYKVIETIEKTVDCNSSLDTSSLLVLAWVISVAGVMVICRKKRNV